MFNQHKGEVGKKGEKGKRIINRGSGYFWIFGLVEMNGCTFRLFAKSPGKRTYLNQPMSTLFQHIYFSPQILLFG